VGGGGGLVTAWTVQNGGSRDVRCWLGKTIAEAEGWGRDSVGGERTSDTGRVGGPDPLSKKGFQNQLIVFHSTQNIKEFKRNS
jgi:hypothetical protein